MNISLTLSSKHNFISCLWNLKYRWKQKTITSIQEANNKLALAKLNPCLKKKKKKASFSDHVTFLSSVITALKILCAVNPPWVIGQETMRDGKG